MKHPEELGTILSRIREVAEDGGTFTCLDLIRCWLGWHHSDDWDECLACLVVEGELECKGNTYSRRKTMQEVKKVYKALQETPEGKLISLMAQSDLCRYPLDYREGGITYAPEGSMGIFTDDTRGKARHTGRANKGRCTENGGILVIYEAIPLGEMMNKAIDLTFASRDRYPAILLGKEVWREKPRELALPEPKFKVGDRVIVKRTGGGCSSHDLESIFTISGVVWEEGWYPHYHYYEGNETPADEDTLELALPEPEWVDVTKECGVEIYTSTEGYHLVRVDHQGFGVVQLGLGEPWITHNTSYKVEGKSLFRDKFLWFRVLKKDC